MAHGWGRRQFLAATALGAAASCTRGPRPISAAEPVSGSGPPDAGAPAAPEVPIDHRDPGAITMADIAAAEKLAAVSYTDGERALIAQTIEEQLGWVRARRAITLGFEDAPATLFEPVLPGLALPRGRDRIVGSRARGALPADDADIAFAPVTALARWLRSRALTSERLTEIYLARLESLGAKLHCVVTATRERALAEARAADREIARGRYRGPLHGVPYGAKDLLDTAGIATTWGAAPYRDRVPTSDAVVVRRLAEAGAVMVAKLSLGALAYGDIWFAERTRNPWNPVEGSSGSSAGSAAATAAGLVGFAIGTETLGSIVSPSMRCGTTGLRPTFGRVARTGAMPLSWTMDKIGPITRTVEDAALVLAAIHGADPGDPSSRTVPLVFDGNASLRGTRLGYVPAWFEGEAATEVDRAALTAARELGVALVELTPIELPFDALLPILMAEAAAAFEELTLGDRDDELVWQDKEAWPNGFRTTRFVSAVDLVQADRLRRQVMVAFRDLLADVDAIIGPSFAGGMLIASNFTGHPSLVLRAGFAEREPENFPPRDEVLGPPFRAPRGISLWGHLYGEGALCRLGMALERALGVWAERPPVG